jgi:signal transduction histidine kinase/ActR/RegA family two-component response regulator
MLRPGRLRASDAVGPRRWLAAPALAVALAAVYFAAAKIGLTLASVHVSATAVWPPTGIAIAAVLLGGHRVWPGIFLGAFLANLTTAGSVATVFGIAAGNTLESVLAGSLVRRFANGPRCWDRAEGVLRFALLAAVVSTAVSATIGVSSLALGGYADWARFGPIWLTWWLGDAAGALLVTPPVVLWAVDRRLAWSRARALEAALLVLALSIVSLVVFGDVVAFLGRNHPIEFLTIPCLVLIAFRFGPRETATSILLVSTVAIWGTLRGSGPFGSYARSENLLLLQAYMAVMATMSLALSSAILEHQRGQDTLRRQEERLRESQKLEAIGRLAGGIAHDFNNLLTVIIGRSQLLLRRLREPDPQHGDVLLIHKTAERAAILTRQLLAFSRKQILQPRVIEVESVVRALAPMLHRLLGEDIDLRIVAGGGSTRIKVDPGQLEQVIVNLAANARDAMPQGGRLTIAIGVTEASYGMVSSPVELLPSPYVTLRVSDSGMGMDETTRARIFEPFFTTKEVGKGTGLGLAMVHGFVHQSDGHIEVASEPGRGTTFSISVPRTEAPAEPTGPAWGGPLNPVQATETILLVEDSVEVAHVTADMLREVGYTVIAAREPTEALRLATEHAGPIHLLITDVIMPQMSGAALAPQIAALRPDIKVLYVSGHTEDALSRHVDGPQINLLEKPFGVEALRRMVRDVLTGAACHVVHSSNS